MCTSPQMCAQRGPPALSPGGWGETEAGGSRSSEEEPREGSCCHQAALPHRAGNRLRLPALRHQRSPAAPGGVRPRLRSRAGISASPRHHLGITFRGVEVASASLPCPAQPFPQSVFGVWGVGGISSPRSPPALFDFWPLPGLRCSRWISPPRAARGGRSTPKPSLGVGTGGGCHPQPLTPRCRSPVRGAGAAKIPPRGCVGWGTGAAQQGWGIFGGVRTVPSSGARRVSAVFLPLCAGEAGGAAANTASS